MTDTYTASITSSDNEEPGFGGPTTVTLTIEGYGDSNWTGTLIAPVPSPSAGPGTVLVRLSDGPAGTESAQASYDPSSAPQLRGISGFTRAIGVA
jgi:hypothetical protein